MSKTATITLAVLAGLVLLVGGTCASTYNQLVALQQEVEAQWAQVENVYQRRLDLVPNLVETVKGAAAFEKETFTAVAEARTRVSQVAQDAAPKGARDAAALERYQQAQEQLGGALSRLLVVVERYPELRATQAFRDLQAQLEGTENRIAIERMRFNEAAQRFNTRRQSFPTNLIAGLFGDRFGVRPYFRAAPGSERAPEVRFGGKGA
ncbi:MAG: LemA family protein [Polyangia bacterium]